MKLSVIVPVYNVEKTLERCVKSIISQHIRDYEVLLINDCSTDNSGAICDQLAKEYRHIRVIHGKENKGISEVRNLGLRKSHGQHIMFVDSDDYLTQDTLSELITLVTVHPDYDVLEFPAYLYYGSKKVRRLQFRNKVYHDMVDYWLDCEAYQHAYLWNKVFRAGVFRGIEFPKGKVFEDAAMMPAILKNAQTIATTNFGLYYYCYNPNGITSTATGEELACLLEAHLNFLKEHISHTDTTTAAFAKFYASILNVQITVYEQTGKAPELPYMKVKPITIKLKALRILGIKRLCQLFKLIHKIKPINR